MVRPQTLPQPQIPRTTLRINFPDGDRIAAHPRAAYLPGPCGNTFRCDRRGPRHRHRHVRWPHRALRPGGRAVRRSQLLPCHCAGRTGRDRRRIHRHGPWRLSSPPVATPSTTSPSACAKNARSSSAPATKKKRSTRSSSNTACAEANAEPVLEALKRRPQAWVDFMMRFELGLEEPRRKPRHRSRPHHRLSPTSPAASSHCFLT